MGRKYDFSPETLYFSAHSGYIVEGGRLVGVELWNSSPFYLNARRPVCEAC